MALNVNMSTSLNFLENLAKAIMHVLKRWIWEYWQLFFFFFSGHWLSGPTFLRNYLREKAGLWSLPSGGYLGRYHQKTLKDQDKTESTRGLSIQSTCAFQDAASQTSPLFLCPCAGACAQRSHKHGHWVPKALVLNWADFALVALGNVWRHSWFSRLRDTIGI